MYELLKTRFGKAAHHYDTHATAQKQISEKLFSLLTGYLQKTEPRQKGGMGNFLEIGCGTGNLSNQLLTLTPDNLLLNDICPEYLPVLEAKLNCHATAPASPVRFICTDAGKLPHHPAVTPSAPFRLIASASAIQWMENPLEFLIECKQMLEPDALLAVSTFAPENLHQVNAITGCTLNYPAPEQIRAILEPHYSLLHLSSEELTLTFSHPSEILRHLKLTGVNGIRTHRWTKRDLELFTEQYQQRHCTPEGACPLTYKPVFIICRNRKTN